MRTIIAAIFLLALPFSAARAAVVTNPVRVSGAGAIDPAGSQTVDFNGAGAGFASQATLEADPAFGAIQSFSGFVSATTPPQNYIDFTAGYIPDIALGMTGKFTTNSGASFNSASNISTSDTRGIRFRINTTSTAGSGGTLTYTIDFGRYDVATGAFDGSVNSVDKAGFTISSFGSGHSLSVRFIAADGTVLSTQTATGTNTDTIDGGTGAEVYFGHDSTGVFDRLISLIQIDDTATDGSAASADYLDDLGFTMVPEANGGTALIAMIIATILQRPARRRHRIRRRAVRFGRRPEMSPEVDPRRIAPTTATPLPSLPMRRAA